ncbi:MAG: undecaprenyl-diphosphate phosphatase, partial [Nanoarchaeota archaeon]
MEDIISALIMAVVQGITEWLPVSSSGHLVLAQKILNYNASLLFDVALHFGTLMAVFVYFGKDIVDIVRDLLLCDILRPLKVFCFAKNPHF